ncbi:MAG: DMT family transporter [Pelagibacteraceae bacterium]
MNKKFFSLTCALVTSFIWGTAFVAQDMGMDHIGPLTFTSARLILGFLTLLPFVILIDLKKIKNNNYDFKKIFFYLLFIGFLIAYGNALQQYALLYTDVANTAVFTVLYVVFVPFVSYFFFSKKIHWSVWLSALMCLLGGLFLTELDNVTVRLGDSIALFNALFWSFHIVFISRLLKFFNFPITIAALQCLIGSVLTFLPASIFEEVVFSNILLEYKEILYVGVLSSGFAFLLQIFSQQNLSPAPVAIIFSLEGAIAAIAGWVILNQFLTEIKVFGIFLIIFAVIFSQIAPLYKKKLTN